MVIETTKSASPESTLAVTVPVAPRNSPVPPVTGETAGGLPISCSISSVTTISPRPVSVIVAPGQLSPSGR